MPNRKEPYLLIVRYDPQSMPSIISGLIAYRQFLTQDEAFWNGQCRIRFEVLSQCDDFVGMIAKSKLAQIVFNYYGLAESQCRADALLSAVPFSAETAFFLRACVLLEFSSPELHLDLQDELFKTAKMICLVSRQINDAGKMWISDQEIFGLMPLFMMSLCNPHYAYLLGGFIVPYWDNELVPDGEAILGVLVEHLGYRYETLKAFCYCDNVMARARMFTTVSLSSYSEARTDLPFLASPTPLLTLFRQQPEEFTKFRQLLIQRFAEQPYLQYCDDPRYYTTNPLENILLTILYPWDPDAENSFELDEDKPEKTLQGMFIDGAAEQVAADLKTSIEQFLGHPIVSLQRQIEGEPAVIHDRDGDGRCYHYNQNYGLDYRTGMYRWKDLITQAFPQGKQMWAYIESGQHAEVLETIDACDIRAVAKQGRFSLSETIESLLGPYDSFHRELVWIIQDLLYDWINDDYDRSERVKNKQKLLRLLDIIHRWNDLVPFPTNLMSLVVDEHQFLSEPEFMTRYHGDWVHRLVNLVKEVADYRGIIESMHFNQCYSLLHAYRTEALGVVKQLTADSSLPLATRAALLAGIVHRDREKKQSDALTQYAIDFLHQHLQTLVYKQLILYSEFPAHFADIDKDQRGLAETEILADWCFIDGYFQGDHDDQLGVIDRLNRWMNQETGDRAVSETQIYYEFLNDFEEDTQKLLICTLVMAGYPMSEPVTEASGSIDDFPQHRASSASSPQTIWPQRFMGLWLAIAPCKISRMLGYFYLEKSLVNEDKACQIRQFSMSLVPYGLSSDAALAYAIEATIDMLSSDDFSPPEMAQILSPYFEIYLKDQESDSSANRVETALQLIKPQREQSFYIAMQKACPALKITYFDQALQQLLCRCLYQRMLEQQQGVGQVHDELPDDVQQTNIHQEDTEQIYADKKHVEQQNNRQHNAQQDHGLLGEEALSALTQFSAWMQQSTQLTSYQIDTLIDTCDRFGLADFETPYGQTGLRHLLWYASPTRRDNVLKLLVAQPSLGLAGCYHEARIEPLNFCQMMPAYGITPEHLLSLILARRWWRCLPWFKTVYDLHALMPNLALDDQLNILQALALDARHHDFIDYYADNQPCKIQNLVADIQADRHNKPWT